jgi:hypothetical protein
MTTGPRACSGERSRRWLVVLVVAVACGCVAAPGQASEHFRSCGTFKLSDPVNVQVHRVSCATARRILMAYFRAGEPSGPRRVKGFPQWSCSSGRIGGSCFEGSYGPGVPSIGFAFNNRLHHSSDRPAAAGRSCGTERVIPGTLSPPKPGSSGRPGIPYKIIVLRGPVSCHKARALIKATGEGKGTWHEAPSVSATYTSFPGGWSCALATGGGYGCWRGRRIGAYGHAEEVSGIQL